MTEKYSPQKHEWGTDASTKYAKSITPGEGKKKEKKESKDFFEFREELDEATYQFIEEGFLDDMLADFEPVSQAEINKVMKKSDAALTKYVKPKSSYKSYKPRKYKGQKQEGFAQYVRSQGELKKACGGKVTLENIIKIFAMGNIKVADNFQPMIDITELWKVREYDRKMIDGFTGKNTEAEMKKLTADIKKNGIKEHGYVSIDRRKNGDVEVLLGEGNHRLGIAKAVGIKQMPIMFSYGNLR